MGYLPDNKGGAYVASSDNLFILSDTEWWLGKLIIRSLTPWVCETEDTHHYLHRPGWGPGRENIYAARLLRFCKCRNSLRTRHLNRLGYLHVLWHETRRIGNLLKGIYKSLGTFQSIIGVSPLRLMVQVVGFGHSFPNAWFLLTYLRANPSLASSPLTVPKPVGYLKLLVGTFSTIMDG